MKTLRQQATAICNKYQEEALEGHEQEAEGATVSTQARDRTIAYVKQWPNALPLRGIIIGQYPRDTDNLPPLAASFAHNEGEESTLFAEIMAHQMCLCCPGAKQSSVLDAIRDCWKLTEQGVLSVHALPLGATKGTRGPARRKDWENLQIGSLANTLAQLLGLSSQMGISGHVTMVAVGKWAELVAQQVEDSLKTDDVQWATGWILERHNLYHPGYIWHKYRKERVPCVVMGEQVALRALHSLFMATNRKPASSQLLLPMEAKRQPSSKQVQSPAQVPPTSSTKRKPNSRKPTVQDELQGDEPAGGSEEQKPEQRPPKPAERTIQDVLQYLTNWHITK